MLKKHIVVTAVVLQAALQSYTPYVVFADETPVVSTASWSQEYTDLTKKILLSGIELERYSLNFRLDNGKQPRLRKYRYFLAQETGAACGLAFEIVGIDQFGRGRRRPLQ